MADDRFYVKTLRMQNFRCFEDVTLGPFDPHFNLLVGENGAGKSSVLVALARLFWRLSASFFESGAFDLAIADDIRLEHSINGVGVTTLKPMPAFELSATAMFEGQALRTTDIVDRQPSRHQELPSLYDEKTNVKCLPARTSAGLLADRPSPFIAFYRTARAFAPNARRDDSSPARWRMRESAFRSWTDAGLTTDDLRSWFQNETLAALQSVQREIQGGPTEVRTLPMVGDAVLQAFDGAIGIQYDADQEDIVVTFADGLRANYSKMSDGQRTLIGLVADIARRACVLNASYLGSRTLDETSGLVLIDEIDLHLHPKWQRRIVPALKEIFPKIQFFATTHSPQVIGEAKPEEIVVLTKDGQQQRPAGSYGMDSNWILECVMEAEGRDPEIGKRIKSLFDLIEEDRLEEAKAEIRKLREELPAVAPDIVSAEAYICNLEHGADEAAE